MIPGLKFTSVLELVFSMDNQYHASTQIDKKQSNSFFNCALHCAMHKVRLLLINLCTSKFLPSVQVYLTY